jgi:hypothetical protein
MIPKTLRSTIEDRKNLQSTSFLAYEPGLSQCTLERERTSTPIKRVDAREQTRKRSSFGTRRGWGIGLALAVHFFGM